MIDEEGVPKGNVVFDSDDAGFIEQLCRDAGCYHHIGGSGYIESLQNYDSNVPRKMGVFAYLHKNSGGYYWVATPKERIDANDAIIYQNALVDWRYYPGIMHDNSDGIWFEIRPLHDSNYFEAIKALKRISIWYY
ncbi:hypothetical protein ACFLUO_02465 [Chloroflexota bacterium]